MSLQRVLHKPLPDELFVVALEDGFSIHWSENLAIKQMEKLAKEKEPKKTQLFRYQKGKQIGEA